MVNLCFYISSKSDLSETAAHWITLSKSEKNQSSSTLFSLMACLVSASDANLLEASLNLVRNKSFEKGLQVLGSVQSARTPLFHALMACCLEGTSNDSSELIKVALERIGSINDLPKEIQESINRL